MQCEICGQEIRGRPQRVTLEGTTLEVCPRCAQHGTPSKVWTPTRAKLSPTGKTITVKKAKHDIFDAKEELIADYDTVIRKAREDAGLTIEQLAAKINEKASLIRKIERGDMHPEDSVRKKLEHTLHIKLTEQITAEDYKTTTTSKGTTLGDIAIIKRK
jgi:putative transcription factor